jgi:hypothetical protein
MVVVGALRRGLLLLYQSLAGGKNFLDREASKIYGLTNRPPDLATSLQGRTPTMLKAIKKTRVYEDIVAQLKELIAEGKVKPGEQLPSERELSEMFQVSRASVRSSRSDRVRAPTSPQASRRSSPPSP